MDGIGRTIESDRIARAPFLRWNLVPLSRVNPLPYRISRTRFKPAALDQSIDFDPGVNWLLNRIHVPFHSKILGWDGLDAFPDFLVLQFDWDVGYQIVS